MTLTGYRIETEEGPIEVVGPSFCSGYQDVKYVETGKMSVRGTQLLLRHQELTK